MATTQRCRHGLDSRFCAVCNKLRVRNPTLEEILEFLDDQQVRATDRAVAEVIGVDPQMGSRVGDRRPEKSWVVNADTGLPTGYQQHETHPELLRRPEIIRTGRELGLRMTVWKAARTRPHDNI